LESCDSLISKIYDTQSVQQKRVTEMGRINVDISDELEKQLRLKTVERFGGKKGDLSRALQEAVKTWLDKKE
jgi:hypothetical protein